MAGRRYGRRKTALGVSLCLGMALVLVATVTGLAGGAAGPGHHWGRASPPRAATTTPGSTSTTSTSTTTTTTTTSPPADPATGAAGTTSTLGAPGGTVVTIIPGFEGIYEFAGNNSSADATDPDLAGVDLVYYWSEIEPEKGVFDWSQIESDMAPWVAAGKKVIIRISTSGAASWDPPYSANGTPAWVYADGARSVTDNGETLPVYWDQAYLSDYQSFVQSFGAQFDGNPNVSFIEAGIGMGGETLPETGASAAGIAAWEADGYTDSLWLSTVETIASYFESSFEVTPVYALPDSTFFDGNATDINTLMAWFRSLPNWGLQNDGLSATQTLSSDWAGGPLALEQSTSTENSGDCLCDDIENGLNNLHGNYLLIYKTDIDNPDNFAYLAQAADEAS